MAEQTMIVRGGRDMGNCVQIEGTWYIRRDSWYMDAAEMEDGFDVFIESGYYSKLELPTTDEDHAFVATFVAEKERKEAERNSKLYRENNTALFIPSVDQRVFFRLSKGEKAHGKIVELSAMNHMVRVRMDGRHPVNPTWVCPYYLDLEESHRPEAFSRETESTLHFYDLNDVQVKS